MKRIVFSILAFCAVAFSLNAQMTAQTKAVLASIEKANESIKTITSPVSETRTLPNGKAFVSSGNFYFANPDRLSILYTNPQGDYLIVNTEEIAQKKKQGRTFRLSLKKNETIKELSSTLLWCISGKLIRLAEANNASVKVSEANGLINVVFTAEVKTGRDFKKIDLKYEKATLRLKSMAMTDKNNIVTKYTMDKPQYGTSIPASVFIVK